MKRDVQVGVILGVIILAIIGVFLSTRTRVKEPVIPIPEIDEDVRLELLSINELPEKQPDTALHERTSKNNASSSEEIKTADSESNRAQNQKLKEQETVIEGVWKNSNKVLEYEEPGKTEDTEEADTTDQITQKALPPKAEKQKDSPPEQAPFIYTVRPGDSLRKIAKKYYGNAQQWSLILEANQEKIKDRNRLFIGMKLILPEIEADAANPAIKKQPVQIVSHKTEKQFKKHIVQEGDTLYKLAIKYYNDGTKWEKILKANRDIIKNENILLAGQELIIPDI